VLVAGVVIATAAYAKKKQDDFTFPPKAHHVIYALWHMEKDGTKTFVAVRVRDVQESGAWREWAAGKGPDGKDRASTHEEPANSKYPGTNLYKSLAWFRSRPNFLREEMILGYRCFTLDTGESEQTFSQELGLTPLKYVSGDTVIEALKIY